MILSLRRSIIRAIFRGIFRLMYRVQITGLENIPRKGGYLIAYNHVSIVDPAFVLSFWADSPEAIAAKEVWHRRGQATLIRLYGTIPIARGEYNRTVLKLMEEILTSGKALAIAPEGGRSHTPGMRRAHPGIAFLMERVSVPVIPVGVVGNTREAMRSALRGSRPPIEMRVGRPFHLPAVSDLSLSRHEARQWKTDLIMQEIAQLLPEEYRGVYANRVASPAKTAQ